MKEQPEGVARQKKAKVKKKLGIGKVKNALVKGEPKDQAMKPVIPVSGRVPKSGSSPEMESYAKRRNRQLGSKRRGY